MKSWKVKTALISVLNIQFSLIVQDSWQLKIFNKKMLKYKKNSLSSSLGLTLDTVGPKIKLNTIAVFWRS